MDCPRNHTILYIALASLLFISLGCKKTLNTEAPTLPIIEYSFWMYDSVEGDNSITHFTLDRLIKIQYDPNVDKCYSPQNNLASARIDTFDRSSLWKRGYVNRTDLHHRIIFNGDSITIHHSVPQFQGNTGFRYTSGVRL